jgi:hypothetical protein
MTLNDSQQKFITDRVTNVWKGKRECPICISRTTWAISTLVEVREFNEGNHCPGAKLRVHRSVQRHCIGCR